MILKFIRRIDSTIASMMVLTIFLLSSYIYLKDVKKENEQYKELYHQLFILKNLDIKLDSFIVVQKGLENYDEIVKDVKTFEEILDLYNNEEIYENFGKNLKQYYFLIKYDFSEKRRIIEKYKSYKSLILYSFSYIMDLEQEIKKEKLTVVTDPEDVHIAVSKIVFSILQNYMNYTNNSSDILEQIAILKKLTKDVKNDTLEHFLLHANFLEEHIFLLKVLEKEYLSINLNEEINKYQTYFITRFHKLEDIQDTIYNLIFFLSGFLLIIIIFSYIRSLKLKEELISFRYAVENSDDSIVVTDVNRKIVYVNDAFSKVTGYSKEEAFGKNPNILKSGKMPQEFYENMNEVLNRGEKWSGEFINKDKYGKIYYEQASITPMFKGGVLKGYLAIKLNITDYIKQKQQVEFLAYHDSLTKLPNRRYMKQEIENALEEEKKSGIDLMFLDLDGFKFINDTLGHNVGDILLKKISARLKSSVGKKGIVFRTGGDEFAIIIKYNTHVSPSAKLARKIVEEVNRTTVIGKHKLKVGISIGIAKYDNIKDDLISLLRHADIAMYEAKTKGKNRFQYYTKELANRLQRKMQTERLLENAINNHEMYVVYQPKYELDSKKIVAFEALLRWDSKEFGLVSPEYFIPIAEEMSIIHDIGIFVFSRACLDFIQLKDKYKDLKSISINLSTSQLMNKNLLNEFKKVVKEMNINPTYVALEITETNIMKNIDKSAEILNEMKKFGFEIELDDFGTGYSSMSYLKKLPIARIKIDKSFVDDIARDDSDIKIIKAIVSMAKSFGYKTIAEGIESSKQEDLLKELGVDFGQGFYFSKPKRKEELI